MRQGLAAATINNHLPAIKTVFKWRGTNEHIWNSDHWKWHHRSIALSVRSINKLQTAVTYQHFCTVCDQLQWPGVKMSFILGFLGLLRVSNLAVGVNGAVDKSRHTLFQDCKLTKSSLTIHLKWSKGNQLGTDVISLPKMKQPLICPVENRQTYLDSLTPVSHQPDWPWFVHQQAGHIFWPSCDDVRLLHARVWEIENLTAAAYTLHSLRRGGVAPGGYPTPWAVVVRCYQILLKKAQLFALSPFQIPSRFVIW